MPRAEIPESAVDALSEFERDHHRDGTVKPRLALQDIAPILYALWLEPLKEEGEVACCHACGYIDDPRQASCASCGAPPQMQRLPMALTTSIRRDCMRQLKEELLGEDFQYEIAMEIVRLRQHQQNPDAELPEEVPEGDPLFIEIDHGLRAALDSTSKEGQDHA